ncbi:MAG: phosphatidylglycerol lysyltransferase domain-containing protein [Candidatus Planktophila sp.]
MATSSKAPRSLAALLVLQSASLVGLLSIHKFPHLVRIVGRDLHSTVTNLTEAASLIIAISLIMIAQGISRRHRRAWKLATALQSSLIAIGIFHNLHRYISHGFTSHIVYGAFGATHLLLEITILATLIYHRNKFKTLPNRHTRISDLTYFLKVSLLSFGVALVVVEIDSKYFVSKPSLLQSIEISIKGFFGISSSIPYSAPRYQERLETILVFLGAFIAATTIARILRPVDVKTYQSRETRIALKSLLEKYKSHDSLGYFALRNDKSLIWSNNSKAAIAYSVKQGVMIATGDPLGDPECWPSAIANFIEEAELHGWTPAIYGCTEYAGEIWRRETGFEALEIGDEAIVLVASYTIDTPQMKNVRQTLNRARKEGNSTTTKKISEIDEETLKEFSRKADEWRRGGDERGFSMALDRFCSPEDADAVIAWAENNGQCVALLQFAPWGVDGLSLDLMRRSPQSSPGINELLIHSTIEYARKNNIEKISLNFATFRSIFERGERLGAGPITRFNHKVLIFASRFFQMESLYRFNAKFAPLWEPRFLLFPSVGKFAKISIAILRVEAFLPHFTLAIFKRKSK